VDGKRLHDPYRPERRSSMETKGNCAAYVSPTTNQDWDCAQRKADAVRVDAALNQASATQSKAGQNDTVG
jgi:hypothetical protein